MGKGVKGFEPGNRKGLNSRFSSANQPKKRGRKPSLYKSAKKLTDDLLTKQDFINVIRYLWEQPLSKIIRLKKEAETPGTDIPTWIYIFINAMLYEAKRGKTNLLQYSWDVAFGKDPVNIEVNNQINLVNNQYSINLGSLSDKDLLQIDTLITELNILLTKAGGKDYLIDLECFRSGSIR